MRRQKILSEVGWRTYWDTNWMRSRGDCEDNVGGQLTNIMAVFPLNKVQRHTRRQWKLPEFLWTTYWCIHWMKYSDDCEDDVYCQRSAKIAVVFPLDTVQWHTGNCQRLAPERSSIPLDKLQYIWRYWETGWRLERYLYQTKCTVDN